MAYRVYIVNGSYRDLVQKCDTLDEAEFVAEHEGEVTGDYVYVVNSDNDIVFMVNETEDEGLVYDEF